MQNPSTVMSDSLSAITTKISDYLSDASTPRSEIIVIVISSYTSDYLFMMRTGTRDDAWLFSYSLII